MDWWSQMSDEIGFRFIPGIKPLNPSNEPCYVVFANEKLLTYLDAGPIWEPLTRMQSQALELSFSVEQHLGDYHNQSCYLLALEQELPLPPGYQWESVRNLILRGALLDEAFYAVSSGLQVLHWLSGHRYCGRCGRPTHCHEHERAMVCERCECRYYPRLAPCIITVITRGDECLLARNSKYRQGFYSALAGFIEPGESIENALRREVMEEVGLTVSNLRYFGSQPWPFPSQLMIGLHADYHAGEICVDGEEITDARWWHYRELPMVPSSATLSGQLIQHFVEQCSTARE